MTTKMIIALCLFAATYILLILLPKARAYIALGSATLFIALGFLPASKAFFAVDWNVIMMIGGTMGIVALFIKSKMPSRLADILIKKTPNVMWSTIVLSLFAGIISAFVDNVATVLMVAPIAIGIAKKLNISPVKSVICIAIAANLQGAATLVGDSTSIMLGGYAGLDFLDFFVLDGKAGMFWFVQIGAIAATLVLMVVLRHDKQRISIEATTTIEDYFPSFLLLAMIAILIGASFIPNKLDVTNGLICISLLVVGLVYDAIKNKRVRVIKDTLKEIDFFTLALLAGLFLVIAGIKEVGLVDKIAEAFVKMGNNNLFLMYTIIVWFSVLLSAFIDNIPYVATMLPVIQGVAAILGVNPLLLYFGLLSGATVGGNLTPIGASANITALGILRKEGHEVSAGTFMKISVPYTLAAVTVSYVLIWLVWAPNPFVFT